MKPGNWVQHTPPPELQHIGAYPFWLHVFGSTPSAISLPTIFWKGQLVFCSLNIIDNADSVTDGWKHTMERDLRANREAIHNRNKFSNAVDEHA